MSLTKSQTNNLSAIFSGNKFVIPNYQRKYSWEPEHRQALWNDIYESIHTPINHYIGTLAFRESEIDSIDTNDIYEVIDGQQRLTTLFILLSVFINKITDLKIKAERERMIIGERGTLKLLPLGDDSVFFESLIFEFENIKKDTLIKKSQIQLYNAKEEFLAYTKPIKHQDDILGYVKFILKNIEVLVFNVDNEAQAVKMFSIINDRGLDLSFLDKTKSTLMYYSTLFLSERQNKNIHNAFGTIFDSYDNVMLLKDKTGVFQQFNEVTLFTQHYYSLRKLFKREWNYKIGAEEIFKSIKRVCEEKKTNETQLEGFIVSYCTDFTSFAKTYSSLFEDINNDVHNADPFQFLEFTATLFPLIVRLKERDKLNELIELLTIVEVRVYKLKGTNPRNHMYDLSSRVVEEDLSVDQVRNFLMDFLNRFMNDYNFKNVLKEAISHNASVKYMIYRYMGQKLTLPEYRELQKEHIFSSNPTFDVKEYDFMDEEYPYEKDRLGNITLLEKVLNIKADNNSPDIKAPNYIQSGLQDTRYIGGLIGHDNFKKSSVDSRRQEIISFLLDEFSYL